MQFIIKFLVYFVVLQLKLERIEIGRYLVAEKRIQRFEIDVSILHDDNHLPSGDRMLICLHRELKKRLLLYVVIIKDKN